MRYLVALSGGLDSCVLLHQLYQQSLQNSDIHCRVIHVNHGLSNNADSWQQFCQQLVSSYNFELIVKKISIEKNSEYSLEALARQKRYQVFADVLQAGEILVTAHTENDQAETLLLQLIRGAGPKGLSAMPKQKTFAEGQHQRPLLGTTRESLEQYAQSHQLQWIEDESNVNRRFDRNYIRHEIIPLLKKRFPSVVATLARSAQHFSEAQSLLDDLADLDIQQAKTAQINCLSLPAVLTLSQSRQKNCLRRFIHLNNAIQPNSARLEQMVDSFLLATADKNPIIIWDQWVLRRYKDKIYLLVNKEDKAVDAIYAWDLQQELQLPEECGVLTAVNQVGQGIRSNIDFKKITVRFRQGGESIKLNGHTQSIKKLLQQWQVPPWQRNSLPLIFYEKRLIAVVGYAISDDFRCEQASQGIVIKKRLIS